MKKIITLIFLLTFNMLILASCNGHVPEDVSNTTKYKVCCTVYPGYDWARNVVGSSENFEISYLLDNGEDMHSYQPSVSDIALIADADIFVYVGGPSDEWVEGLLINNGKTGQVRINMMDELAENLKEEEIIEGMQSRESEEEDVGEDIEYDEHIWLSLDNAAVIVKAIEREMSSMDGDNASLYSDNSERYISELMNLKSKYQEKIEDYGSRTVIVADRFPFRYLVDEYGIDYYAAFPGCSAESESSFETIVFLIEKADELGIGTIYIIENSDDSLANTIIENSSGDIEVATLDSMQSVTLADIDEGASYIDYMKQNMEAIIQGFH